MNTFTKAISLFAVAAYTLPVGAYPFEKIAPENLKSSQAAPEPDVSNFETYTAYLSWAFDKQQKMDPWRKREKFFGMLQKYEKLHPCVHSDVMDFTSIQDLNLLCGSRSNPAFYLASRLDRTRTTFGSLMFLQALTQPIADASQLRNRQKIVQEVVANTEVFTELEDIFQHLADAENLMLMVENNTDFSREAKKRLLQIVGSSYIPGADSLISACNKNSIALGVLQRFNGLKDMAWAGVTAAGATLFPLMCIAKAAGYGQQEALLKEYAASCGASDTVSMFTAVGFTMWLFRKLVPEDRVTGGLYSAATGFSYGNFAYHAVDGIQGNVFVFLRLQKIMKSVALLIEAMERVERLIVNNPVFRNACPEAAMFQEVLHDMPKESADFKRLLQLLRTNTFRGDASVFSRIGRIVAAYNLALEHQEVFTKGLIALGRMEVYLSTARLYKEGMNRNGAWCFPEYRECAPSDLKPYICLKDFWNPFIDAKVAVANSIVLGDESNPRTALITGPNAGGKSTTMKAIVECCILGQTLGIMPAQLGVFTPFNKIKTYINITDDIAAGNSHFKAGVLRAQEFMVMLDALPANEICLTALDEVFNGTTYVEGQAAAYGLLDAMGHHPRNICISITHFPLLTNLERENNGLYFKNYKVSVLKDEQGRIRYPFKLEAGVAHQNIALDILEQEGFSAAFLKKAHAMADSAAT